MKGKITCILLVLESALIAWLSLSPASPEPYVGGVAYPDLILHFIAYSIFGFLAFNVPGFFGKKNTILFAIMLAALFGGSMELLQMLVPGRFGDFTDIAANMLGSGMGGFLASRAFSSETQKRKS